VFCNARIKIYETIIPPAAHIVNKKPKSGEILPRFSDSNKEVLSGNANRKK
jgi:hypothetical protein